MRILIDSPPHLFFCFCQDWIDGFIAVYRIQVDFHVRVAELKQNIL